MEVTNVIVHKIEIDESILSFKDSKEVHSSLHFRSQRDIFYNLTSFSAQLRSLSLYLFCAKGYTFYTLYNMKC